MIDRLQALVQGFFTERLLQQRRASPHTVASYRDTFRLLLRFASERHHVSPTKLTLEKIDAPLIGEFLLHLEKHRGNSARSRNTRLAAIRSFFQYVALYEPKLALNCQRILAIPNKRYQRRPVAFLDHAEIEALLSAPDTSTWIGRRDRALLSVALQTGLRVSELSGLRCKDVELGTGAHVRCEGKGRKERCTPLRREVKAVLKEWIKEQSCQPEEFVFPTAVGHRLSRDAIGHLVTKHAATASDRCQSLKAKKITPHVLRHSAAMDLLHSGVSVTVISLWLGHESPETTQIYLHADMGMKEAALARTTPSGAVAKRYRASDSLLTFLDGL